MDTTHAAIPSAAAPLCSERFVAILTLALLVSCVFDVGRVLYYRMRLDYAVSRSARVLARATAGTTEPARAPAAADLVRSLSGVTDLSPTAVRVSDTPSAVVVRARYFVPIVSPPLWPVFGDVPIAIDAIGSHRTAAP